LGLQKTAKNRRDKISRLFYLLPRNYLP